MSDRYLHLDANFVKAEIGKLLALHPELAEDEELRLDTIEAETDAHRIIERALVQALDAEALAEGLGSRVQNMTRRASRFMAKAEAMRSLIRAVMKAAKLDKLTLPDATISIIKPKQSVGIENIDDLPQGYFKLTRTADKTAIRQAFDNGEQVPGAIMVLGSEGITIRTK